MNLGGLLVLRDERLVEWLLRGDVRYHNSGAEKPLLDHNHSRLQYISAQLSMQLLSSLTTKTSVSGISSPISACLSPASRLLIFTPSFLNDSRLLRVILTCPLIMVLVTPSCLEGLGGRCNLGRDHDGRLSSQVFLSICRSNDASKVGDEPQAHSIFDYFAGD
ncbi:hypothetical protein RRG08_029618 [Elysia crispata]|uniref:Uncharacterized protein n=1 Tax=Elysia crispata TaxID=231223 RepID=A0AAE0XQH0_9GAST|nr:hypothetical protein RRG08_029618 [Elysia crispata]